MGEQTLVTVLAGALLSPVLAHLVLQAADHRLLRLLRSGCRSCRGLVTVTGGGSAALRPLVRAIEGAALTGA